MKFISNAEYEALQQKLERLQAYEEDAKTERDKSEIARLKKRLSDVQSQQADVLDEVNGEHEEELDALRAAHRRDTRSLEKKHEQAVEKLDERAEALEAKVAKQDRRIQTLETEVEALDEREAEVAKRERELEVKETQLEQDLSIFETTKTSVGTFEEQVAAIRKEADVRVAAALEDAKKLMYADGVADGIRTGRDLGDKDRELLEKVTLIALARNDQTLQDELGTIAKDNLRGILTPKAPANKQDSKKS